MPRILVLLLALSLGACRAAPPAAASPGLAAASPSLVAPGRLLAVGDLHGDLANARRALQLAGLIDEGDRWSGGDAWVVQTGDLTDKGPDTRAVLDLWMSLERQAAEAGGRAIVLTSNHEALNVAGQSHYVAPEDLLAFLPARAAGLAATRADLEEGARLRREALGPEGVYGRWIAGHDAIAVVNGVVFLHAGLEPARAARGIAALNAEIRAALAAGRYEGEVRDRDGPLWYRGFVQDPEFLACPRLAASLRDVGATRMVVGHTPEADGRIGARCGGRLLDIDTGISRAMGGHPSALDLTGGDARALLPDGVADLPDP
jgi:hypothetical protein